MTNPKADAYVANAKRWPAEFAKLRKIALDCPLTEEFKWGHPCYALDGQNVFLMHGFKDHCALRVQRRLRVTVRGCVSPVTVSSPAFTALIRPRKRSGIRCGTPATF